MITHQQRLYAENRAKGLGKKAAAVAAGCPEKSASQAASRYEKSPDVIAHMERIGFDPSKKSKPAVKPKSKKPDQTSDAEALAAQKLQARAESCGSGFDCPLEYMKHLMNAESEDPKLRLDASKALASFTIAKPGEKGKKEERQEAADRVAGSGGKFGVQAAPLRSVK